MWRRILLSVFGSVLDAIDYVNAIRHERQMNKIRPPKSEKEREAP